MEETSFPIFGVPGSTGNNPLIPDAKSSEKEKDEFFQQLLNWQDNPSLLLNTLKQMKQEQMGLGQKEEFIEEKEPDEDYDEEGMNSESLPSEGLLGPNAENECTPKIKDGSKPPGPKLEATIGGQQIKESMSSIKSFGKGGSGVINEEDIFSHTKERTNFQNQELVAAGNNVINKSSSGHKPNFNRTLTPNDIGG